MDLLALGMLIDGLITWLACYWYFHSRTENAPRQLLAFADLDSTQQPKHT
jgi:hypothetical protein